MKDSHSIASLRLPCQNAGGHPNVWEEPLTGRLKTAIKRFRGKAKTCLPFSRASLTVSCCVPKLPHFLRVMRRPRTSALPVFPPFPRFLTLFPFAISLRVLSETCSAPSPIAGEHEPDPYIPTCTAAQGSRLSARLQAPRGNGGRRALPPPRPCCPVPLHFPFPKGPLPVPRFILTQTHRSEQGAGLRALPCRGLSSHKIPPSNPTSRRGASPCRGLSSHKIHSRPWAFACGAPPWHGSSSHKTTSMFARGWGARAQSGGAPAALERPPTFCWRFAEKWAEDWAENVSHGATRPSPRGLCLPPGREAPD